MIILILIAIAAGVSTVIARNLNSILANKIGLLEGTFFNFGTGLLLSAIFLLLSGEFSNLSFISLRSVPFWAFFGGLIGIILVAISSLVVPKISAFYFTLLMFLGQLLAGMLIDYFSHNTISVGKIIGGLLVVSGLTYNLIIDRYKTVETDTLY